MNKRNNLVKKKNPVLSKINHWSRAVPFEAKNQQQEIWTYQNTKTKKNYQVDVTFGKLLDILSLKLNMIENFDAQVKQIRDSRTALFRKQNLKCVDLCPICHQQTKTAVKIFKVYKAIYAQCQYCSHCFVTHRPTKKYVNAFYTHDKLYQSTYADSKNTAIRIEQVAMPKVKWAVKQFERIYGRKPKAILDVGAGSGHFVQACKKSGLRADGLELSHDGITFCKKNFGFNLINKDFIKNWKTLTDDYEIITFWGLIEHVPYPRQMLNAASNLLKNKDGLVIATVPRWNCFSSAVQKIFLNSIVRHLDPLAHINCFTDSSLATAFVMSKLDPVAAWYFGMDAYELATQTSYLFQDSTMIKKIGQCLPQFQASFDLARLSDEIALIGKPTKNFI